MLLTLECPTADVSAFDLGVAFDGPLPEILAERTITHGDSSLHLGIIGASHVATVTHPRGSFREEISCFAGKPGSLVSQQRTGYELQASIRRCADFEAEAGRVLELAEDPDWLFARFPGLGPFHVTAVTGRCEEQTWVWETFHLYPEEEIIVKTVSRYRS
ncbi:DUF2617 family protein [Corynebacterium sp. H130]|uniref:DUF2617 family protein n=1 Tax=Corynebacterium sp. H130 TaxID=3133444 RepID=UPI00309B908F